MAAAGTLGQPAEEFGNDSRVETLWAMKAMEQAEVYFNILCSVDPKQIPRLSPCDDDIYAKFRESFPDLKVGSLKEADLKSEGAKKEWREFCEGFKHVEDYSFASLLRLDAEKDYSEENSIIATKIQFYAIELARNREDHNQEIRQKFKPTPRKKRVKETSSSANGAKVQNMNELEYELQQIITGQHALLK